MDSKTAADLVEELFLTVKTSVWVPQYNFDFDGIWHLVHRGFTVEQVKEFLRCFNRGVGEKLLSPGSPEIGVEIVKQLKDILINGNDDSNSFTVGVKTIDESLAEFNL